MDSAASPSLRSGNTLFRLSVAITLACGLLDTTAVFNTASFGIGVYIVASGLIGLLLVMRSLSLGERQHDSEGFPERIVVPVAIAVAFLWTMATTQTVLQIAEPGTVIAQTALRTILLGHFLVCVLVLKTIDSQPYVLKVLTIMLTSYICYGIYDFCAQIFGLPRFLSFLRNNSSLALTTMSGAQGWIGLPRILSLASEPSATMMPLTLAVFVFFQLRGALRVLLIGLAGLFCIGTFARSIWIAFVAGGCMSFAFWLLESMFGTRVRLRNVLVTIVAMLPLLVVIAVPFLTRIPPDADISLVERIESSRSWTPLFQTHPLLGVGFEGWMDRPLAFVAPESSLEFLDYIHNSGALYMTALGIVGILIVYMPIFMILANGGLPLPWKGWWVGVYGLSSLGGDYMAMASTWTAIAVAVCWTIHIRRTPVASTSLPA